VAFGVNALGLGGGAEQFGDIGEAFGLGLLGKGAVFLVGLAFAGECFLEIVLGRGHVVSSMVRFVGQCAGRSVRFLQK
jgi:hypothetical protein